MSEYSDFILGLGAEIHLPLEEDVGVTAIVNTGSESANTIGIHTDTVNRQANLVYDELYSIRYLSSSLSVITNTSPITFGTLLSWIKLDDSNDILFTLENESVTNSEIIFYIEGSQIKIDYQGVIKTTGIFLTIDSITHIAIKRVGISFKFYINGVLKSTISLALITELFDKLTISNIVIIVVDNLVSETGDTFVGDDLLPLTVEA
jgi:hypothetical protein